MSKTSRRHTILLVDDNPTNLNVLLDSLRQHGFKLLAAKNGEEALKRAEYVNPDLILLDVRMPGIDGFETCRQLKERSATKNIPVIFMTALSDTVDKIRGFSLGAVDYITKPFQHEEVLARVNAHLTIRDLTQQLEDSNAQLRKSLELEQEVSRLKTGLVSMASHEIRKPLTAMNLYMSNLRPDKNVNDEKRWEALHVLQNGINSITGLLDDILIATQSESGKLVFQPELVNLGQLVQTFVEEMKKIDEQNHEISLVIEKNQEQACVDPKLLRHSIMNLISNALKYSTSNQPIECRLSVNGKYATFTVKDKGIGIPKSDQERLFKNFERASNVGTIKGTGLGLAIVKQCIDLHKGMIAFSSEVGVGTEFSIKFPYDVDLTDH